MRAAPAALKCLLPGVGLLLAGTAHAQQRPASLPAVPDRAVAAHRFYVGLEAGLFFNAATQFAPAFSSLKPNQDVNPTAALVLGYRLTSKVAVELRAQDIPVTSGFDYASTTASGDYTGFGEAYTHDYVYVPVLGVWQVLGKPRLSLAVTGGGGVAFTDTSPSLVTPNNTRVYYIDGQGAVGVGAVAPPGATVTGKTSQYITREQKAFAMVEAGLRGTWWLRPRFGLDLSARYLWGLSASVRELDLYIQTPTDLVVTTQRTPVRGVCAGLSVRYRL